VPHGDFDAVRREGFDQRCGVWELGGEGDEFDGGGDVVVTVDGGCGCGARVEERGGVGAVLGGVEVRAFGVGAE
jgi:hypothetical protein